MSTYGFKFYAFKRTCTYTWRPTFHRRRSLVNLRGGARHFCPKKYVWKMTTVPKFYMILARKINKFPEFHTIFARKMPEFYIIFFPDFFFLGGGHVPCPPSHTPMLYTCMGQEFLNTLSGHILTEYWGIIPTLIQQPIPECGTFVIFSLV